MFDLKEIFTAGMILFAVIDIIGSTPIIIDLRQKVGHIQSEKASLVALVLMIGFLFRGKKSSTSLVLMSTLLRSPDPSSFFLLHLK